MIYQVHGTPAPQGSKTYYGPGKMTESSKALKPWRQLVADTLAVEHGRYKGDATAPLMVRLMFVFVKPKSAPKSRVRPTVKPDIDKLSRAILDAGKGILWHDDAQVCRLDAAKVYGDVAKVVIECQLMGRPFDA